MTIETMTIEMTTIEMAIIEIIATEIMTTEIIAERVVEKNDCWNNNHRVNDHRDDNHWDNDWRHNDRWAEAKACWRTPPRGWRASPARAHRLRLLHHLTISSPPHTPLQVCTNRAPPHTHPHSFTSVHQQSTTHPHSFTSVHRAPQTHTHPRENTRPHSRHARAKRTKANAGGIRRCSSTCAPSTRCP